MNDYEKRSVAAHLSLVRYLLSKADERGRPHREKHHFLQVAIGEVLDARAIVSGLRRDVVGRNADTNPVSVGEDVSDIPF